jgi:serine/threonine protein phosphatase PrpC
LTCAVCGEALNPTDLFCESCGEPTDLGARKVLADHRQEDDEGAVAAVSDIGRVRRRNEDAYTLAVEGSGRAAVVCDGVATTSDSGLAAVAAARAALDHLRKGLGDTDTWAGLMADAIRAAQDQLTEHPDSGVTGFEGSTTIVAVLARSGQVVAGNVGDSRAYWVGLDGSRALLSTDDTWVREAIESGIPAAAARLSPRAHEITGWLGPDAGAIQPHVATYSAPGEGFVVVCSDGLWNYSESADSIAALVQSSPDPAPVGIARHLLEFALDAGGGDNVTVAVVDTRAGSRPSDIDLPAEEEP